MRHTTAGVAALMLTMSLTTGCGLLTKSDVKNIEVLLDVTGTTAEKITYQVTGDAATAQNPQTVDHPALPWHDGSVPEVKKSGSASITVLPQGGPATCKITVSKKVAAKKTGDPGVPLVCTATLR